MQKNSQGDSSVIVRDGRNIATFSTIRDSNVQDSRQFIVFESGLGDDHSVWNDVVSLLRESTDTVTYDRAGYGKSDSSTGSRDIEALRQDLESVIGRFANGRKVVLVGHSLGGMVVRDYAVKHPEDVAGIVFVDASHERYNRPTVEDIARMRRVFAWFFWKPWMVHECEALIKDSEYAARLPNLPDVPVIALTSMKEDAEHTSADRRRWYDSKEALGIGVTDFTHVTTSKSGHYVMFEDPDLVAESVLAVLLGGWINSQRIHNE